MSLTDEWNNKHKPCKGSWRGGPHITRNLAGLCISTVSGAWLSQGYHKLGSLSSVVLPDFRFHESHAVKGSGKQNKEHEKENRKGIWRATLSEDLVWFSWRVLSCSSDQLKLPCSFSSPHTPLNEIPMQRCGADAINVLLGFCQLIWGTLAGDSEPAFGTNRLGRWRPSTCSESKFGVFPMHLWSEHTRVFFFLFFSP